MTSRVEVRPSGIHGFGLFALEAIPRRRNVGELTGELVSEAEGQRRASRGQCIAIVEFDDGVSLDASQGNEFRHVNHSCDPNTIMRRVEHRVEFHSRRRIEAGEELTCDYGETHHDGQLPCRCGSARCRGAI
jgi:SET domain-containing protein